MRRAVFHLVEGLATEVAHPEQVLVRELEQLPTLTMLFRVTSCRPASAVEVLMGMSHMFGGRWAGR